MRIVRVEYLEDYKLKLTFGNKEVRVADLAEKIKHAKGIFLPLKDLEYFKKVEVDSCQLSIFWPNGADICLDVLYKMGHSVSKKKPPLKKSSAASRNSKQIARRSKTKAKS